MISKEQIENVNNANIISAVTEPNNQPLIELKKYSKDKEFNILKLENEIITSNCIDNFRNVGESGTHIYIYGDSVLDESILDSIVSNHEYITLEEVKEIKYNEIDIKTQSIISEGFEFDNNIFSLSLAAQSNLTNIKTSKDTFSAMNLFPLQMNTKDNKIYMLEESDVDAFWGAGLNKVKTAYTSGGDLKNQITNAINIQEVESVIDNR